MDQKVTVKAAKACRTNNYEANLNSIGLQLIFFWKLNMTGLQNFIDWCRICLPKLERLRGT